MESMPTRLQKLYEAAAQIGTRFDRSLEAVLDPCGLILEKPPRESYYWCTPRTAKTFASTGGDGVHYSYLQVSEVSPDETVIVTSMPANDQLNYVVAESFDEFLGLGYHVGWFALEQIAYSPEWALQHFANEDPETRHEAKARLAALRSELGIRYVPLNLQRIEALTNLYAHHLEVPAEPPQ
jgi:hypothetical protein